MKIGIIVQARMASTRLPGKIMKEILGKPILEHVILRLMPVKNTDKIVIATTKNARDDIVAELARKLGVGIFRGSEDNVLERFYEAADQFHLDPIVRITSDCPLIDSGVVERVINFYCERQPVDYVTTGIERTFPRGMGAEVFSFKTLEKAYKEATKNYEKEHVTPYIYENRMKFKIGIYKNDVDYSHHRWTVDTIEDFELVNIIYSKLYRQKANFSFGDILHLFEEEPELIKINQDIRQKVFWE